MPESKPLITTIRTVRDELVALIADLTEHARDQETTVAHLGGILTHAENALTDADELLTDDKTDDKTPPTRRRT